MSSQLTVDELFARLFGERCLHAIDQTDVENTSSTEESSLTLDEVAEHHLGKTTTAAFPEIDLKEERVGIELTLQELNVRVSMQGLSLILSIVFFASLILGSGVVLTILQTILYR